MWQSAHGPLCGPLVIGNPAWLNLPWFQLVSVALWQVSQVVGNPAAT